ncbi:DUF559 domain-containing protein [Sphingomonas sp. G-3-2-10]|nr:DUF559 domain-containing protein [Sphingomonas sp. G-3-2-10]
MLREAFPEARCRRQVPFRQYFADFASHRYKLIVEADGGQHRPDTDAVRTGTIRSRWLSRVALLEQRYPRGIPEA